jgi:hypothetical protein
VDRHLRRARVKLATVAALLMLAGCSATTPAARSADSGMRQLRATSPSGAVSWPVVFRWDGGAPSDVVRVHIFDEAERPIFGMEVRGSSAEAPKALRSKLSPGARYQWRVARVDENGDESDASELTVFQVK